MARSLGSSDARRTPSAGRWLVVALVAALSSAGCATQPRNASRVSDDSIPAILTRAAAGPYRPADPDDCTGLAAEIGELDTALGPDLDALAGGGKTDGVAEVFAGALRGLIPYRGVIRFLTGAERRERRVAAAVAAGSVRRAYLKGLGESRGCLPPAAPRQPAGSGPTPETR